MYTRGLSRIVQPRNMKNRDIYWRRYKIEEPLYTEQWRFSPSKVGTLNLTQSPSPALLYFPESHRQSEVSSFSKMILVLGKARSLRAPNLGYSVAESPGWFHVSPKISAWDMMHEQAYCHDEAANHQLPIAVAFWIIQIVSLDKC